VGVLGLGDGVDGVVTIASTSDVRTEKREYSEYLVKAEHIENKRKSD
jgi:hypothetical protein